MISLYAVHCDVNAWQAAQSEAMTSIEISSTQVAHGLVMDYRVSMKAAGVHFGANQAGTINCVLSRQCC